MPAATQWLTLPAGHSHILWRRRTVSPGDEELTDAEQLALICAAMGLVLMAGLMSGLTLGLMSLDEVDLEVLKRSGTSRQRAYAARILPVISKPHRLLVTLLVCNAIAAEALPLVLDRLTDPITAVLISVTVVLLFGEIIPQAACSAYGLEIGAKSAGFVRALVFLASPVAIPIAWVLDRVLGHRRTALFRRGELKALVDIHGEGQAFGGKLNADEVRIIKGALDLTNKRAKSVMTPLDMVFMLSLDATLDEETLTAILASGHSRVPVHHPGNQANILGILLVKELIMVDIHAGVKVSSMKVRSLPHLLGETPLYDMLKLFELGRSHMAVLTQPTREALAKRRAELDGLAFDIYSISDGDFGSDDEEEEDDEEAQKRERQQRRENSGQIGHAGSRDRRRSDSEAQLTGTSSEADSDGSGSDVSGVFQLRFEPSELQPVGIITLEDVLEELISAQIVDETDRYVDNLHVTKVNAADMARSLPPHLRKVLSERLMTPRVGPASSIYRMSSGGDTVFISPEKPPRTRTSMEKLAGSRGDVFAAHLPRVMLPSRPSVGSIAAGVSAVGTMSARYHRYGGGSRHGHAQRRSTNFTQSVQDQLNLLEPLLATARSGRGLLPELGEHHAEGLDAEDAAAEAEALLSSSLQRQSSI